MDHVVGDQDVNSERNLSHKDNFPLEMAELKTVSMSPSAACSTRPWLSALLLLGTRPTRLASLSLLTRSSAKIVQMIPFLSKRKAMGVLVEVSENKYRHYIKGALEILNNLCERHVVVCRPISGSQLDSKDVVTAPITKLEEEDILCTVILHTNEMLRTLIIAYRKFPAWLPTGHTCAIDKVPYETIADELPLIGVADIEAPLHPGVNDAVAKCPGAGVKIKMCTGNNVLTACSIASQCSIFTAGGVIVCRNLLVSMVDDC